MQNGSLSNTNEKKTRKRLPDELWMVAARQLLVWDTPPVRTALKMDLGVGNNDTMKKIYEKLITAMTNLVGKGETGRPAWKPPECLDYGLSAKEERSLRKCFRLYMAKLGIGKLGYDAIIFCIPKYKDNLWELHDIRFAITRIITNNGDTTASAMLKSVVDRYYSDVFEDVIIAPRFMDQLYIDVLQKSEMKFQLCYDLEDEARRTYLAKKRLMFNELAKLNTAISEAGIWPVDRRTKASIRLDERLDNFVSRYMFFIKFGDKTLDQKVEMLVKEAYRILHENTSQ